MSVRQTKYGQVRGVPGEHEGIELFKGIPFAAPPVGELRFRAPQPPESWEGIREADQYPAVAWQQFFEPGSFCEKEFFHNENFVCSEDCLYLNVCAPEEKPALPMPVFVWIHGGAFLHGNSHEKEFDGETFVKKGVIYVSIQYRTGALGFLTHPELKEESPEGIAGNYAILDQIAALTWVKENIAAFGGDPDNVTVAGQSAGCMSVWCLLHSPKARGLFRRAILQSGYGFAKADRTEEMDIRAASALMEKMGVSTIRQLRACGAAELRDQWYAVKEEFGELGWGPHADGIVIDESVLDPTASPLWDADILIGSTGNDIGWEDGYPLRKGAIRFGENSLRNGRKPVYLYYFDRKLPGDDAGAFHSAELWYEFGTLSRCWRPMTPWDYTLSDIISSYWANFAKTGDPNGPGLPHWPAYTRDCPAEMLLADTVESRTQRP